jgi:hypothetical protein
MSLISKEQLGLVLQSISKILSQTKIATDDDALDVLISIGVVDPVVSIDNSIYTNSRGEIYTL